MAASVDDTVRPRNPTAAHHLFLYATVTVLGEVAKNKCCYNVNVHSISQGFPPWSTLTWVFDHCGIHLYAQPTITPTERVGPPIDDFQDGGPCSDQCYLQPQIAMMDPKRGGSSNIDNANQGTKEETGEMLVVNEASNVVRASIRQWKCSEEIVAS